MKYDSPNPPLEMTTRTSRSLADPIVWASVVATAAAVAAAAWLPARRLWGINHLAFYPVWLRLAALCVISLSAVPAVRRGVGVALSWFVTEVPNRRKTAAWLTAVLAILSVCVFFALRSSTLLMGDGQLVANKLVQEFASDSHGVAGSLRNIISTERIAPGSSLLQYLSAAAVTGMSGRPPLDGVRILNCILGGLFVFLILRVMLRSSLSAEARLWLGILVFTSGAMELFFGYVEHYTLLFLIGSLYVITAFRAIHRRGPLWLPAVLAVAAACAHVLGITLWPSLVILTIWRSAGRRGDMALRAVATMLTALMIVSVYGMAAMTSLGRFFLPFFGDKTSYGVVSPAHWADILNELLLVLLSFVLIVAMAIAWRPGEPHAGRAEYPKGRTPWLTLPVEWYFTGFLLLPMFIYLVFFNPEIGMPRDWDLFAIAALGLIPLSLLVINRAGEVRTRALVAPALLLSGVLAAAWIGINASPARTIERFERFIAYDSSRADYAYEMLSRHYYSAHQFPEAIEAQKKAYEQSHNPRFKYNLAILYRDSGDRKDAIATLRELIAEKPGYLEAQRFIVGLLYIDGQLEEACEHAREGAERHPKDFIYPYYLGKSLIRLGQIPEGREALESCRELRVPGPVRADIDSTLASLGDPR